MIRGFHDQHIPQVLATGKFDISTFTIMIQKEVAERLVASSGNKTYGVVTVLTDLLCDKKILFDVPPEAFTPRPKVMSSIIQFSFKKSNLVYKTLKDYNTFRNTVKALFQKRRKMIRNTIPQLLLEATIDKITSVEVTRRPESLNLEEFILLSNEIFEL